MAKSKKVSETFATFIPFDSIPEKGKIVKAYFPSGKPPKKPLINLKRTRITPHPKNMAKNALEALEKCQKGTPAEKDFIDVPQSNHNIAKSRADCSVHLLSHIEKYRILVKCAAEGIEDCIYSWKKTPPKEQPHFEWPELISEKDWNWVTFSFMPALRRANVSESFIESIETANKTLLELKLSNFDKYLNDKKEFEETQANLFKAYDLLSQYCDEKLSSNNGIENSRMGQLEMTSKNINSETCKWAISELESLRDDMLYSPPAATVLSMMLEQVDPTNLPVTPFNRAKMIADRIKVSLPEISTMQNYKQELLDWCDKHLQILKSKLDDNLKTKNNTEKQAGGNVENGNDFKNFLTEINQRLDSAIIDNPKIKTLLIEHSEKIIRATQEYSDFIYRAKQISDEKGWPQGNDDECLKKIPENSNLQFYQFFIDAFDKNNPLCKPNEIFNCFWIENKPVNPLQYILAMVDGWQDNKELYKGLEVGDYRYFLLTCIHDCQNDIAGFEKIYFSPQDDKELKNRICTALWDKLKYYVEKGYMTKPARIIELALQQLLNTAIKEKIETEQDSVKTSENKNCGEWSKPMAKTDIMTRLGLGLRGYRKLNTFVKDHPIKQVANNRQLWQIRIDKMSENIRKKFA
jgi:hypothetical protein